VLGTVTPLFVCSAAERTKHSREQKERQKEMVKGDVQKLQSEERAKQLEEAKYMTLARYADDRELNDELKEEWEKYLGQTKRHVEIVQELMTALGVRPLETPGRLVVRHIGVSLVGAIKLAKRMAPPEAAEIVACECVVHAETKDHANWELLTTYGQAVKGDEKKAIDGATDEIEDEEDEHLYHSKGWCRELAIASLGLKAVLPPPEEQKDVKTAIGAARAKQARTELI